MSKRKNNKAANRQRQAMRNQNNVPKNAQQTVSTLITTPGTDATTTTAAEPPASAKPTTSSAKATSAKMSTPKKMALICAGIALSFVALAVLAIWFGTEPNRKISAAAQRFDDSFDPDTLNSMPAYVVYHFDGNWLLANGNNKPRTLIQTDETPVNVPPSWVEEGLSKINDTPNSKHTEYAAYYFKNYEKWEKERAQICSVLGSALFERPQDFNDEELERIEASLIFYMENMLAVS